MNDYISTDGIPINFKEQLEKKINDESNNSDFNDKCLISQTPLERNYIRFPCNHSFNYNSIYIEIINQKRVLSHQTNKLSVNEIKCPYCRTKYNFILPFIIENNFNYKKIKGVNFPSKYSMKLHNCTHKLTSGKNKGKSCSHNAFASDIGTYCTKHYLMIKNKEKQTSQTLCNAILKSGKRKGEPCGCKVKCGSVCNRHKKKL
jgi:hypothetical protein